MSTRVYYDDFSATYDDGRDRGYHALIDDLTVDAVGPRLSGARVLEAGCGTGLLLGRFAARADRAVGLDLSAGMLSRARGRGLDVVQGDLRHLPFADASFDVTCAFKVLAHVPERDAAVAELARVTRPGGTLFLEFYNRRSLRYLARRAAGARAIGTRHTEDDVPTRWDTPAELARAFPADLRLRRWHGVRVVTPFGAALSQPGVGALLAAVERRLRASPAARWGGFLIAELERVARG